MGESIFPGYEHQMVSIGYQRHSVHVGGSGTPLLLLHGYPQNHTAWLKLAAPLAGHFTCVIADRPGYGASSIPADVPAHESFSKRRMAALLMSVMASMGHNDFSVMGHDSGARVAYRMALDHSTKIRRVVIIEVVPTSDMWNAFDAEMAMKAYHWSFLAQPSPLPERLIAGDPVFYLEIGALEHTHCKVCSGLLAALRTGHSHVRLTPITRHSRTDDQCPLSAMCGRLPVGKSFLEVLHGCGRCCHVSGLLMRRLPMAAGHNALREIGSRSKARSQKLPWHKWGVPISGSTG